MPPASMCLPSAELIQQVVAISSYRIQAFEQAREAGCKTLIGVADARHCPAQVCLSRYPAARKSPIKKASISSSKVGTVQVGPKE